METNKRTIKIEAEEKDILSNLFDEETYLEQNFDVAQAGIDPLDHYIAFGFAEGRSPGDNFDADYYLTRNPDVAEAGIDPLEHYVTSGFEQGRLAQNDFSIELKYGEGTENFTPEMIEAVEAAADTWEDAISRSTFEEGHTLEITVAGTELEKKNVPGLENPRPSLAQAGPISDSLKSDANNKNLPTEGISIVNTSAETLQLFEDDPDLLVGTMTHELGHVMGIGTLWEQNDLIDPITGTYHSDTIAGEAFQRIYNTDVDIPLSQIDTNGNGEKVFGHWDERSFGNELMSPQAEDSGISKPLSEITLGSLEDIGWNVFDGAAELFPDLDTHDTLGFNDDPI